jgi:protein-disulfide isomerase
MPKLKETYIDTGKLYFEFRDYPLSYHPGSIVAASFANCAAQQGQFWQLHDRIVTGFADREWIEGNRTDQLLFAQYAKELNLDTSSIESCRSNNTSFEGALQRDMDAAEALGIRGTPMFVLNGQVLFGSYSYSTWQQLFDARLAAEPAAQAQAGQFSRQIVFVLLGAGLFILAVGGLVGLITYRIMKGRSA